MNTEWHKGKPSCEKITLWRARVKRLMDHPDYYVDHEAGMDPINFIEKQIKHCHAPHDGQPFILTDFQKWDIIYPIFSIKHRGGEKKDQRLINEVFLLISKKSGKSALIAALLIYLLYKTPGEGHEIICAATCLEQTKLVYEKFIKNFIKKNPLLNHKTVTKIYTSPHRILSLKNNSKLFPVSSNLDNVDGQGGTAVVVDEIHRLKDGAAWELMCSSSAARHSPLLFGISTAGDSQTSFAYGLYERGNRVLKSGAELQEPFFAPIFYEIDDLEKWNDIEELKKSCPNIGVSVKESYLLEKIEKAENDKTQRHNFVRFFANRFSGWTPDKLIDLNDWNKGIITDKKMNEIMGNHKLTWTLGIDLSQNIDFTALCLCARDGDKYYYKNEYYTWKNNDDWSIREKEEKLPFSKWEKEGSLHTTWGNQIDPDFIRKRIEDLIKEYSPQRVVFDPSMAYYLKYQYDKDKTGIEHKGNWSNWNAATVRFRELVQQVKIFHTAANLEAFNVECALACYTNDGLVKPIKANKKSIDKIDGLVAAVMAIRGHLDIELSEDSTDYSNDEVKKSLASLQKFF
jgi:phage terminase large subunit-like protein